MQRSTIRIKKEDQERIRDLAGERGISQEKFMSNLLDQFEEAPEGETEAEAPLQLQKEQLLKTEKCIQMLYRIIRTVCPLTEEDVDDPDFDIGLEDVYEDKNKHPEKY